MVSPHRPILSLALRSSAGAVIALVIGGLGACGGGGGSSSSSPTSEGEANHPPTVTIASVSLGGFDLTDALVSGIRAYDPNTSQDLQLATLSFSLNGQTLSIQTISGRVFDTEYLYESLPEGNNTLEICATDKLGAKGCVQEPVSVVRDSPAYHAELSMVAPDLTIHPIVDGTFAVNAQTATYSDGTYTIEDLFKADTFVVGFPEAADTAFLLMLEKDRLTESQLIYTNNDLQVGRKPMDPGITERENYRSFLYWDRDFDMQHVADKFGAGDNTFFDYPYPNLSVYIDTSGSPDQALVDSITIGLQRGLASADECLKRGPWENPRTYEFSFHTTTTEPPREQMAGKLYIDPLGEANYARAPYLGDTGHIQGSKIYFAGYGPGYGRRAYSHWAEQIVVMLFTGVALTPEGTGNFLTFLTEPKEMDRPMNELDWKGCTAFAALQHATILRTGDLPQPVETEGQAGESPSADGVRFRGRREEGSR